MQKENTLQGKVVLVTGAGSGLGEATARAFAATGCVIICIDVNQPAIERVSLELRVLGTECMALPCDIQDAGAVFLAVQSLGEQLAHLDILVNCAGIDYTLSVDEMSVEQWDREIAVNLRLKMGPSWIKSRLGGRGTPLWYPCYYHHSRRYADALL